MHGRTKLQVGFKGIDRSGVYATGSPCNLDDTVSSLRSHAYTCQRMKLEGGDEENPVAGRKDSQSVEYRRAQSTGRREKVH